MHAGGEIAVGGRGGRCRLGSPHGGSARGVIVVDTRGVGCWGGAGVVLGVLTSQRPVGSASCRPT